MTNKTQNKPSIYLFQIVNHDCLGPKITPDIDPFKYRVTRTTNTLRFHLGDELTKDQVQEMINDGIHVIISNGEELR